MNPKERGELARKTLLEAKARGVKIGRPVHRQRALMITLKEKGWSYRQIARALKCGTSTIQRAIKEEI
jgi:DNA invertase Pin-like site-specific DNA recombinase